MNAIRMIPCSDADSGGLIAGYKVYFSLDNKRGAIRLHMAPVSETQKIRSTICCEDGMPSRLD